MKTIKGSDINPEVRAKQDMDPDTEYVLMEEFRDGNLIRYRVYKSGAQWVKLGTIWSDSIREG